MTRLVVIGAGGFGREALDIVDAMNQDSGTLQVLGVVDSAPSELSLARLVDRKVSYLGTEDDWLASGIETLYVAAIGNPTVRATVVARWQSAGRSSATLIHPSAVIGSRSFVGAGSVICAGAQVSTNVHVGEHVHLNPNSTIGHDTRIDDFASINPGAVISGDVEIGQKALVGAGAVVLQGLRLGQGSIVGAAACVVRDVQACTTVKGVPAK